MLLACEGLGLIPSTTPPLHPLLPTPPPPRLPEAPETKRNGFVFLLLQGPRPWTEAALTQLWRTGQRIYMDLPFCPSVLIFLSQMGLFKPLEDTVAVESRFKGSTKNSRKMAAGELVGGGGGVKTLNCSCRRPGFSCQHPHPGVHNYL